MTATPADNIQYLEHAQQELRRKRNKIARSVNCNIFMKKQDFILLNMKACRELIKRDIEKTIKLISKSKPVKSRSGEVDRLDDLDTMLDSLLGFRYLEERITKLENYYESQVYDPQRGDWIPDILFCSSCNRRKAFYLVPISCKNDFICKPCLEPCVTIYKPGWTFALMTGKMTKL